MKLRNWINHNSLAVTCGALATLVTSMYYLQATMSSPVYKPPTTAYFYDTVTSELFPAKIDDIPPIPTPAGSSLEDHPTGVRAHVFSCTSCADISTRYIAYLETYTDEGREAQILLNRQAMSTATNESIQETSEVDQITRIENGHLVASIQDPKTWFKENSEQGSALVSKAFSQCAPGQFPIQCLPPEDK